MTIRKNATVEKLDIKEIKSYRCSDGTVFDDEDLAIMHERQLKDPEKAKELRIKKLEDRVLGLEAQIHLLNNRIKELESKNGFPWSKPNPDIYPQPWPPYQQPYNPLIPTPKLPSEPGTVVYSGSQGYSKVVNPSGKGETKNEKDIKS